MCGDCTVRTTQQRACEGVQANVDRLMSLAVEYDHAYTELQQAETSEEYCEISDTINGICHEIDQHRKYLGDWIDYALQNARPQQTPMFPLPHFPSWLYS